MAPTRALETWVITTVILSRGKGEVAIWSDSVFLEGILNFLFRFLKYNNYWSVKREREKCWRTRYSNARRT